MMNADQANEVLKDAGPGSLVFVSYKCGRTPTEKAIIEAERATVKEGIPRRYQVGTLTDVWTTKKGHRVFRIFSDVRDTLKNGTMTEGGYRTFAPWLGELLSLEVLDRKPLFWP